jgi:hypothetical protein
MALNRRDFLKGLAGTLGYAVIPKTAFSCGGEQHVIQTLPKNKGLIRESVFYDIETDQYIARYDAATRKQQVCVAVKCGVSGPTDKERKTAIKRLAQVMREQRMSVYDLIVLSLPTGTEVRATYVA